jgi:hypothetical protein
MKKNYTFFIAILIGLLLNNKTMAQTQNPEQVVQTSLDFYNQRNIDGFMQLFSADIALYNFGEATPIATGLEQVRKIYSNLFAQSPALHSTILKRIVFDNKVIDHESIVGRNGATANIELVLIYEVRDEKIYKVTAMRKKV